MKEINIPKSFLIKEYSKKEKSIQTIANFFNCSYATIRNKLIKYKIKIRNSHRSKKLKYDKILTKNFLLRKYVKNQKSLLKLSKELNCCIATIRSRLVKFNIRIRTISEVMKNKKRPDLSKKMKGKTGKQTPNYINGKAYEPYSRKFNNQLKAKIRKRDNYTCQNCGMIEEEHLIVYEQVLEIHHIDYNKKNSKEKNLITLCKQCNIRANKNRNYWKKHFKEKIECLMN